MLGTLNPSTFLLRCPEVDLPRVCLRATDVDVKMLLRSDSRVEVVEQLIQGLRVAAG